MCMIHFLRAKIISLFAPSLCIIAARIEWQYQHQHQALSISFFPLGHYFHISYRVGICILSALTSFARFYYSCRTRIYFPHLFLVSFLGSFSTCRYFSRNIDHLKCIVHSIVQMLWPIPHSIPEFYFPLVGIQFSIVIFFFLSVANLEFYSIA